MSDHKIAPKHAQACDKTRVKVTEWGVQRHFLKLKTKICNGQQKIIRLANFTFTSKFNISFKVFWILTVKHDRFWQDKLDDVCSPRDPKDESHPQRREQGEDAHIKEEVVQLVDVVGRIDVLDRQKSRWKMIRKPVLNW